MDAVLVLGIFLAVMVGCVWLGVTIFRFGSRRAPPPPIPTASVANPAGRDAVYARTTKTAARVGDTIARRALQLIGLAIISAPFVVIYAVYSALSSFGGEGNSKGRILRIRNRAQLPEVATGEGWSADAVVVHGALTAPQRAALGELWLTTARMEHASVAAFSQLSLHLTALAAPSHLLEATHRAALDEIRHARHCFAIVRAITGVAHTAGPITALVDRPRSSIDLTRLALGSLVDGCLAEGIAADVAARGAATATEPAILATLTMIARDEARHADLAWDVLAWCLSHDAPALRAAVAARVEILDRELTPQLPPLPGLDPAALVPFGLVDQDALGALARARVAAVQSRARALLAPAAPARLAA